jgi:esterase/lipase
MKTSSTWNISESTKILNIEKSCQTFASTLLIDIENDDYLLPIDKVCENIYNEIKLFNEILIVSHSYGSLFAVHLAETYPKQIKSLLLLEPVVKNERYKKYLQSLEKTDIIEAKLNNFDDFPDGKSLSNKTIISIHISIDTKTNDSEYMDKIFKHLEVFRTWTNRNLSSEIIVHPCKSHMLNYDIPSKIIDNIKKFVK